MEDPKNLQVGDASQAPADPSQAPAVWQENHTLMPALGSSIGKRPPAGRQAAYDFAGFLPAQDIRADGTMAPRFEAQRILRVPLPAPLEYAEPGVQVSRVAVNRACRAELALALAEIHAAGFWPLLSHYGGGFEPRLIRGSSLLSMHALGLAVDFDPSRNPLGAAPVVCRFGSEPAVGVVRIFRKWGWFWGGHFSGRKDCMHFQFATGC